MEAQELLKWLDDSKAFVIRLDIRMFKVYGYHFKEPFDNRVAAALILTARDCIVNFRDACAVYVFNDEINIIFSDRKSREKETLTTISNMSFKGKEYYNLKHVRGDVEAIDLLSYASSFASFKFNAHLKNQTFKPSETKMIAAANSGQFSFHGDVMSFEPVRCLRYIMKRAKACVGMSQRTFLRHHNHDVILPSVNDINSSDQISKLLEKTKQTKGIDWKDTNEFFRQGIIIKRNITDPVWSFMHIFDNEEESESQLHFLLILDCRLYLSRYKSYFKPFNNDSLKQQVGGDIELKTKIDFTISGQPKQNDNDKYLREIKREIEEEEEPVMKKRRIKRPKQKPAQSTTSVQPTTPTTPTTSTTSTTSTNSATSTTSGQTTTSTASISKTTPTSQTTPSTSQPTISVQSTTPSEMKAAIIAQFISATQSASKNTTHQNTTKTKTTITQTTAPPNIILKPSTSSVFTQSTPKSTPQNNTQQTTLNNTQNIQNTNETQKKDNVVESFQIKMGTQNSNPPPPPVIPKNFISPLPTLSQFSENRNNQNIQKQKQSQNLPNSSNSSNSPNFSIFPTPNITIQKNTPIQPLSQIPNSKKTSPVVSPTKQTSLYSFTTNSKSHQSTQSPFYTKPILSSPVKSKEKSTTTSQTTTSSSAKKPNYFRVVNEEEETLDVNDIIHDSASPTNNNNNNNNNVLQCDESLPSSSNSQKDKNKTQQKKFDLADLDEFLSDDHLSKKEDIFVPDSQPIQRDTDCEPTQPTDYASSSSLSLSLSPPHSPTQQSQSQSQNYSYSANSPPFAFSFGKPIPLVSPPSFNHPFFQRNPTEEEELKLKKRKQFRL